MTSPVSSMSNDALMQLIQQAKQQHQQQQEQTALQQQQQPQHSYEPYSPSPPNSPPNNMSATLSSGAHGTDQLRDTVLYLVQQQKLRHEELVGVVKDLAHSVSSVSVDVQHIKHHGGGGGGGGTNAKTGPKSLPPTHEDATAYQDGDVVGGEIGFAGSYAATQTMWAHTHGSPLAFQREEQLVSAMKRIENLEKETANLRLQVRSRDETIRRLTDAGLRGILNKGNNHNSVSSSHIINSSPASAASPNRSSVVDAYLADRWGTSSLVNDSHRVASPSTATTTGSNGAGYAAQGAIFNSPASPQSRGGGVPTAATPAAAVSSPYTPRK